MATVLIPENGRGDNPLTIYINGVKTTLARGEEISVSDAVAAEIAALNGELLPEEEIPVTDGAHLPRVTEADNGKVATVVDGKWGLGDGGGSGSGGGVLVVHAEAISNESKSQAKASSNTFPISVLDKTWKEIHDAPLAVLKHEGVIYLLSLALYEEGYYGVDFGDAGYFGTVSEDGYPSNEAP